jgi:hypothetical protein
MGLRRVRSQVDLSVNGIRLMRQGLCDSASHPTVDAFTACVILPHTALLVPWGGDC